MPAIAPPTVVRPIRLWVVSIRDTTPGYGLQHQAYVLSSRKPRRKDVLQQLDWRALLGVSPPLEGLERWEKETLEVVVDPAQPSEVRTMLQDGRAQLCLLEEAA